MNGYAMDMTGRLRKLRWEKCAGNDNDRNPQKLEAGLWKKNGEAGTRENCAN